MRASFCQLIVPLCPMAASRSGASRRRKAKNSRQVFQSLGRRAASAGRSMLLIVIASVFLTGVVWGVQTLRTMPTGEVVIQGYSGSAWPT